jgi:hypothetical protein
MRGFTHIVVNENPAAASRAALAEGITCDVNPNFCAACRSADDRKAKGKAPRFSEASYWPNPSDRIPDNWEEMSLEGLLAHFERARRRDGAAGQAVEALMFSLRERGTKALEESNTKRRLSELSDHQLIEVGNRLQRLRPEIARAWTAGEVKTLLQARIKK